MDVDLIPEEEGATATTPTSPALDKVQEFLCWRRKIEPLMKLLDRTPTSNSELEKAICSTENDDPPFDLLMDPGFKDKCKRMYGELQSEVKRKEEEAAGLWGELQVLWGKIREKNEYQLMYTCADAGLIKAITEVKTQFLLREKEMQQRIQLFIEEIRKQISDIWDQCKITEEEKQEFNEFYSTLFTEEMLDKHKEELTRWQIYYKKNQEILDKVKAREEMWSKLRELDAKADDPNRFVNRGGTLLQDQTMHNRISKALPKLEAELIKLADNFEKEHSRKMKICGKEIPKMIEEEWAAFNKEKAAKKGARYAGALLGTPGKFVPGNGSMSLRSTRKSMMPVILPTPLKLPNAGPSFPSSTMRAGDKRPAGGSKPTTPALKRKFASQESVSSINSSSTSNSSIM